MKGIRLPLLLLTGLAIAALFFAGFRLAEIDTDITRYLPRKDPVLADAGYIFTHHPIQDQMVIDVALDADDPDLLVHYGEQVEEALNRSGLFTQVGMKDMQGLIPDLVSHVLDHLPVLFSERDLEREIQPRLTPEAVRERLEAVRRSLLGLEGIGQADMIARDPLGFKDPVMARIALLAPTLAVRIHKGKLLSADGRHLLVPAHPVASGTDTAFARRLTALTDEISRNLESAAARDGHRLTLTPVGAFRAALDNEMIARRDVNQAFLLAALGIALLLVFAFPRPWLGLMAFLPALAGTGAAFVVCALVYPRLSIMALGFGGAIISITVDHGIAYLLFLDRPRETRGREASLEIRAVGLLATLTTMGAFSVLCFSGFPILAQLGLFTALGIGFSFLFVHTVFPRIFPKMPPARPRHLPLQSLTAGLTSFGWKGALACLGFFILMAFFARPVFNVSLAAMNTVSAETEKADALVGNIWGAQVFTKIYLMTEGKSLTALQDQWDGLLARVEADRDAGRLGSGFVPSMIFPGAARREKNLAAWRAFWTPERVGMLRAELAAAGPQLGFSEDAFAPFINTLTTPPHGKEDPGIPEKFHEMMSIRKNAGKTGWMQFSSFTPGPSHDPQGFYDTYRPRGRIFDAALFSQRLGGLLFSAFTRMLVIIGLSTAVLLFIFFWDLRLTIAALLPVVFALVATLGTMKLVGHSLDIPALMLSIIIFGMGIDYSLYLVRARQRYIDAAHPGMGLIRVTVFMAGLSTLIGFGVLYFSEHSLLKSAGMTTFLGIGYSLIGAFFILPPLLERIFSTGVRSETAGKPLTERILARYRNREAYPRFFARFKLKLDAMFAELPRLIETPRAPLTVIDIGCGYGVPAAWILESFPGARVYGIDPDPERVRVAALAWGDRGEARIGHAPELPDLPARADAALLLDIIHFLDDDALNATLEGLALRLRTGGRMIVRAVIPPVNGDYSRMWRFEAFKLRIAGLHPCYRPLDPLLEMIAGQGFRVDFSGPSGGNRESVWIVATCVDPASLSPEDGDVRGPDRG
ncbi:methyltransferase domain-containing protein [Desulfococcus sp.]|uniref:methyltransferase domain-containing protein n=1 Tax=Desulfococcus sp. TaxID=2025834 RepID=UPI0035947C10